MKWIFFFLLLFISFLQIQTFTVGCANIIPPTGGPMDTLPPVLLSATPKDSTLNFNGRRIVFTFDEYIDLENVQGNLLFNPLFENVPVIEARLKTISVRIRDSLDPNTTYTFNFGNAIQDINEGNPFREFTYTFSTGSYIDSLQISGRVILAETGKIDSTLQVVLHTDFTDSAVANKRPRYAARLDSSGRFTFRNLPPDTFAIYAIGDAGTMRRYTSPGQLFAFADAPVTSGTTDSLTLYAYKEEEKPIAARTTTQSQRGNTNAAAEKRLRYSADLSNNQQDLLKDLTLRFELPLRNLDTTKLQLTTDTTFTPVTAYTITQDSTGKELNFITQWREGTVYNLIMDKEFAEDTTGRKLLKTDTLTFTTRKPTDYGRVSITLTNLDTTLNPVLQFVQSDKVVFSTPVKTGVFTQQLFLPGDYDLRILYDRNDNGKWDAGKFFEGKIQPELVRPTNQKITVKPAWDNETTIAVPAG
jgi:hypothetical protein